MGHESTGVGAWPTSPAHAAPTPLQRALCSQTVRRKFIITLYFTNNSIHLFISTNIAIAVVRGIRIRVRSWQLDIDPAGAPFDRSRISQWQGLRIVRSLLVAHDQSVHLLSMNGFWRQQPCAAVIVMCVQYFLPPFLFVAAPFLRGGGGCGLSMSVTKRSRAGIDTDA